MKEYIILESKLNYLSNDELENSNTVDVTQCISRLEKIYQKESTNYRNRVIRNALRFNREQKPMRHKGMYFNNCTGSWCAKREINGKKYHIKSSKDIRVVERALKEFCKKHKISL